MLIFGMIYQNKCRLLNHYDSPNELTFDVVLLITITYRIWIIIMYPHSDSNGLSNTQHRGLHFVDVYRRCMTLVLTVDVPRIG